MGRSVSTPTAHNIAAVAYRTWEPEDEDLLDWEWQDLLDWIKEAAQAQWPSLTECDKWLGREDRAVLENCHCYIGVSEYCGLVAVWLVDKDETILGNVWCAKIEEKFEELFATCRKLGTFSNGESVYEKVA
jgi:hypothetical protein